MLSILTTVSRGWIWQKRPRARPAREEPKPSRLSQWSRGVEAEAWHCLPGLQRQWGGDLLQDKLTASRRPAADMTGKKLFFDRKELAELLAAMRLLDGKLRSGEPVPQGLVVQSLSGDVAFGVSMEGGAALLAMTQRKEYGGGKLRVQTVRLLAGELPMLVKGVEEALEAW